MKTFTEKCINKILNRLLKQPYIKVLTQQSYDALGSNVLSNTLYIIIP